MLDKLEKRFDNRLYETGECYEEMFAKCELKWLLSKKLMAHEDLGWVKPALQSFNQRSRELFRDMDFAN